MVFPPDSSRHAPHSLSVHRYGEAFWNAAKNLLQNEALDKRPIASFDASVIVYLYRHALELFLKETRFVWFGLVLSETVEKAARSFGLERRHGRGDALIGVRAARSAPR
jgi:hypothetical protein